MKKAITSFSIRAAALLTLMLFTILTAPSEAKALTVTVVPTDGGTYRVEDNKLYVTPNSEYYLVSVMNEGIGDPLVATGLAGEEPYYQVQPTDNIIITFKKYSTNVHVTFDLNGHNGTTPNAQDLTLGQSVSQPTGIADDGNYTVCGWSTNRDGTKPYDFSTLLSNTLTYDSKNDYYILKLYAIWANANIDYTVSFNNNGGSGAMGDEMKSCGFLYTIPECDFTNDGYVFIGWAKSASGSVAFSPGQTIFLTTNLTLYAKWAIDTGGSGTVNDPYKIYTTDDLIGLANQVNGGNDYSGKYFKLRNNIFFSPTTDWNDATSAENNFPAIGNNYYRFCGVFDGDGYTISGIRIYKGGDTWGEDSAVGLFGSIGSGGTVKNLTLANARITGYYNVGGIVGYNFGGTIDNCHVLSNVAIHAVHASANFHGGIVGRNDGNGNTVSHCTSAVTLSLGSGAGGSAYGGIVGGGLGTLHDNLSIGVTIPAPAGGKGAIQGSGSGPLQHNYYSNCTVGGTTSGIGSYGTDVTDNDGAVPLLNETTGIAALTSYLSGKINIPVDFTRSFTGSKASTLCLPYDFEPKGGTFYEFTSVNDAWTEVTMTSVNATSTTPLTAGKPYLFMPTADGPLDFTGIITNVASSYTAGTTTPDGSPWTFTGTYEEKRWDATHNSGEIGTIFGFATGQGYEGTAASQDASPGDFIRLNTGGIKPFRAYLKYTGTLARTRGEGGLPETMTVRLVNANGEIQGIGEIRLSTGEVTFDSRAWYDLNGRRLEGQPSEKGIYINGGRKVVIK